MSRALEALLSWFLEAVTFFDNLHTRRSDDEVTREVKALKRRLVWAAGLALGALIGSLLLANFFNAVSDALRNPASLEDSRQVVALTMVAAIGATLVFAAYSGWALWRFVRENSDD